ncbi:MAG: peptide deformylase [Patescibacteria group bacterium]
MDIEIVQEGSAILRTKAREVAPELIGGATLGQEIALMKNILAQEYDGVALAAPQIGISRRIFIVSPRVFGEEATEAMVCINPSIVRKSKSTELLEEGCLSVRYKYGKVKRHTQVTIRYQDQNAVWHERGASGLLAQIFQHEIDHLDGILFIDKAHEIEVLNAQERKEFEQARSRYQKENL